jgi:PKD repeat protein
MYISKRFTKLSIVFIAFLFFFTYPIFPIRLLCLNASPTFSVTAAPNQPTYHLRQAVDVSGSLMQDSSPVSDALVSIEVRNPRDDLFLVRTIPIGNPDESWTVSITDAHILDQSGNPTDKALIDSMVQLFVTVHNNQLNQVSGYVTVTVYDGNLIPIRVAWSPISLSPGGDVSRQWSCYIPEWAYCGKATLHCNVYTNLPKNHGFPYTPEKTFQFYITRNLELGAPYRSPKNSYTTLPGQYNTTFQVPPDSLTFPGDYTVHVTGRYKPDYLILTAYASTTFNVASPPSPPQAAFTYSPLSVYQNMTVTFDASSSSAEGYNDTITQYEWNINDPYNQEHIIKTTPLVTHTFEYDGTYIVELNVTDNEGLWSTTSKPITILSEFGPTANFTWSPDIPVINQTVTFDASNCQEGWSASTQQYSPITTYVWDFDDGTGNQSVTSQTINQTFTEPRNYTVMLTIYDAVERFDTIYYIVEVTNRTAYDINGDCVINVRDIFAVARAFGSEPGDPHWCEACDVNGDDKVNVRDIFAVAMHFGEEVC